jgi:hypothetical protein
VPYDVSYDVPHSARLIVCELTLFKEREREREQHNPDLSAQRALQQLGIAGGLRKIVFGIVRHSLCSFSISLSFISFFL